MLDKLQLVEERYAVMNERSLQPDFYNDPKAATKLLREQRQLEPIVETFRAYKKTKQEQQDLQPAKKLQPKTRAFYYKNMKSAMAEEAVLAMVITQPALFAMTEGLTEQMFSAPVLGRAYDQLKQRYFHGLEVAPSVLMDFTPEEMSHLVGITQRHQGPVNETALTDCIRTILAEHQASGVSTEDDLMALRNQLKERKGVKA